MVGLINRKENNMPNWTINVVHVDDLEEIKKKVFNDKGELDFDLIIPEPRKKEDCDPKYYVTEDSHVQIDDDRPWFNWYDWHCDHWGVKWNCSYDHEGETESTMQFDTPWAEPAPVIRQLSKMFPDQTIRHEYAYEDDGYEEEYVVCYKNGKSIGLH